MGTSRGVAIDDIDMKMGDGSSTESNGFSRCGWIR